jgi:hypothetical protein
VAPATVLLLSAQHPVRRRGWSIRIGAAFLDRLRNADAGRERLFSHPAGGHALSMA